MYRNIKDWIKAIPYVSDMLRKIYHLYETIRHCKKYDIYTMSDYIKEYNPPVTNIHTSGLSKVATLKFYPDYEQKVFNVKLPPTKVLELKDFYIIGNSKLVLDSHGNAIYNDNVGKNVNNLDPALQTGLNPYPTIGKSTYVKILKYNKLCIEEGISLIIIYPHNYYHFTHEVLTVFWLLSKLNIPNRVPLLVNSEVLSIPQFKELLDYFNNENRPIIGVDTLERIFVRNLYLISPIIIYDGVPKHWIEVSNKFPVYNYEALNFIRNKMLESIKTIKIGLPDKIFISRKNYKLRTYNEDEIEIILKNRGYVTIYPEKMSIWEQIQLFNHCKVIVAASGAALTNLLYCAKGTNIVVFLNKTLNMPFYSSISYYLHCNMVYIAADEVVDLNAYHSSFHINPNDLIIALNEIEL